MGSPATTERVSIGSNRSVGRVLMVVGEKALTFSPAEARDLASALCKEADKADGR